MISPRVNYQLCGLNSFYWRNVISTLLHGTRGTAYGSSRYFFSSSLFFSSPLLFSRGGLTDGRSKRRGRSPLAWRGLQPSTALLATGQSLCQVSTYRPTWIFSGLRRNDKPSLLFLRFSLTSSRRETPSSGYLHLSWSLIGPRVFRALGGAPLVSCTSRCFRFIDQNLGRCWSKVRLEAYMDVQLSFHTLLD